MVRLHPSLTLTQRHIHACVISLEQLLSSDTPNITERSLGFLGTLEHLVAESPAPEVPSDVIQAWVVVQRRRLCLELPAPEDRYDEILQHCLVHGGITYMKQQ